MKLRFAGQPFADHPNLVDFIEHARDEGFDELKIAVAWAKRSGLGRVWDVLEDFRAQGGKVLLILGVSEGGATREGLELALQIADQGYVFHDPRRTFHPKVYFASSSGKRSLLVGSSNLTAGGLSWNYEASMWVDWDEGEGEDVTDEVSAWFEGLIAETSSCSPLTVELIAQLEGSSDISIGSEARTRRVQKRDADTPEDNDSAIVATISGLFKPVIAGLRKLPGLSVKIAPVRVNAPSGSRTVAQTQGASGSESNETAPAVSAPLPTNDVQRRWVKKLKPSDAQRPPQPDSKRTGALRLSRETAPIDHKRYFREDLFGGLPWAPVEGREEVQEVFVSFRTWIDGQDMGLQELRLGHAPHRISGQGNITTNLHWGELSKVLANKSHVGQYVSLERTTNGEYNLVISRSSRGDYQV